MKIIKKIDKQKIFNVFFGTSKLPIGKVIITPISKIYQEIKNLYPSIEESKGWWERTEIKVNSFLITILKVPLGSHIKDCLESLDPKQIKKIILLGFCGSLNSKLKIGKIVIPSIAISKNSKIKLLLPLKKNYKIGLVSQMILKLSILKKFLRQKINLLDMETYFIYHWGKRNKVPVISILIITDQPLFQPFFICSKGDLIKIEKAISKIVSKLTQYLFQLN